MTVIAERITPKGLATQFNPRPEIDRILEFPKRVKDNLTHLFAEHVVKVTLQPYNLELTQEGNVVDPESKESILKIANRGPKGDPRFLDEKSGLAKFAQEIINAPDSSFIIWVSGPGPKNLGYGTHAFVYIGIKTDKDGKQFLEDEGELIKGFALKVPFFYNKLAHKTGELLEILSPEAEIPQSATIKDLLLCPISFPIGHSILLPDGQRYEIKDTKGLCRLILNFLKRGFNEREIEKGLSGKILEEVESTFKKDIDSLFNMLLSAAQTVRTESRRIIDRIYQRLTDLTPPNWRGGNCLAARATTSENLTPDNSNEKGTLTCPLCGASFTPPNCPYCDYTAC